MKPTKFDWTITIILLIYMALMIWLSGCSTTHHARTPEPIGPYHISDPSTHHHTHLHHFQ